MHDWRYSPDGKHKAWLKKIEMPKGWRFHPVPGSAPKRIGNLSDLDHDGDGKAGGSASGGSGNEIKALRTQYAEKFGKRPFNGWDADTLKEKLG
jgi:hypothetical protein